MNEQRKPLLLYWTIALLVLCNIGLVATIWLRPTGPQQGNGPAHESPRDFVVRNLKFTDDQTKQYDVLVKEHQNDMHRLRKDAMAYRQQLFAHLATERGNDTYSDSIEQHIAVIQKLIESVTYAHFAQVRTICTATQKPEFDNIITDVIRKMNGGMNGPPPGGGGPPPPRGNREEGRPGENNAGDPPPPPQNQ